MAHKLINLDGQPLEIRLVKRTNAAVGLRNITARPLIYLPRQDSTGSY